MLEITSIAADLMRIFAQRHYSSDHYPAGAEFLTFVYFFFLIIKYL